MAATTTVAATTGRTTAMPVDVSSPSRETSSAAAATARRVAATPSTPAPAAPTMRTSHLGVETALRRPIQQLSLGESRAGAAANAVSHAASADPAAAAAAQEQLLQQQAAPSRIEFKAASAARADAAVAGPSQRIPPAAPQARNASRIRLKAATAPRANDAVGPSQPQALNASVLPGYGTLQTLMPAGAETQSPQRTKGAARSTKAEQGAPNVATVNEVPLQPSEKVVVTNEVAGMQLMEATRRQERQRQQEAAAPHDLTSARPPAGPPVRPSLFDDWEDMA